MLQFLFAAFVGAALFAMIASMLGKSPSALANKHCKHIDSRTEYQQCVEEFLK
jgi:hypothetical protein